MSILLFSTKTCANCPGVKRQLQAAGISFEDIDASKYPLLVKEYGVKAVPTMVVIDEVGTTQTFVGNEIGEFINGL